MFEDDDDEDFPPTKYPGREAFTFILVTIVLLGAIGWIVWALAFAALRVWG